MIYSSIYDLVVTYLFGTVVPGSYYELVAILLSSTLSVCVFALPFIFMALFAILIIRIGGR